MRDSKCHHFKRVPLKIKYWFRNMAKTNYRKHGKRMKFKLEIK